MIYKELKNNNYIIRYFSDEQERGIRELEYVYLTDEGKYSRYLIFTKELDFRILGLNLSSRMTEDNIVFYIEEDDILYPIFDKFMKDDDKYIVETDSILRYNHQYLEFKKINNKIRLKFINKENVCSTDKFNIYVRSLTSDLGKIIFKSDFERKDRLNELFCDFKSFFEIYEDTKQKTLNFS